jgi:hypothetical protein
MYQKYSYEFLFTVCVNFVDSYPKKTILWKMAVYCCATFGYWFFFNDL